jgi:phosphoglucosamine mutase
MTKLFGTDGIRGKAGDPPLDPTTVSRVGAALVRVLKTEQKPAGPTLLIGRDTRESGERLEQDLARGAASEGASVVSAGVIPTPAIAYLTRIEGFDAGIVISASHNPYEDNGIKVFSGRGEKLDEGFELRVEQMVADTAWSIGSRNERSYRKEILRDGSSEVNLRRQPELARHYAQHLQKILPDAGRLKGSRLVIDCANGATTTIAPALFRDLGFEVVAIGDEPDGRNINLHCGSTHLESLREKVLSTSARLGVAFDGDGDRALFVDRHGNTVDGDATLLIAGAQLQREQRLPGSAVVATVMSNIGLELALKERNIRMLRAPVGDKYVMEQMQKHGIALGGEQSGHIIFADHLFTGDGIGTALQVLRIMETTGRELDELAGALVTYPQVLVNVRVRERSDYMKVPAIAETIHGVEERISGHGRVLIRYSGTEPLLRIMLEGKDDGEIRQWANEIADTVKAHLG